MSKKYNILILDDEQNSRELIHQLLLRLQPELFNIYEAENLQKAHEASAKLVFDIVFSDAVMPFSNSLKLKDLIVNRKTQLIICSAMEKDFFEDKFENPTYFLQKPIDIISFNQIVNHAMETLNVYQNNLIL